MGEFAPFLELGSFGLVAYLVVTQFRRLDAHMSATTKILAELTLQVAQLRGARPDETRESARYVKESTA